MEHIRLVQIRRRNSHKSLKNVLLPLDTMSFIRVASVSSVLGLGMLGRVFAFVAFVSCIISSTMVVGSASLFFWRHLTFRTGVGFDPV